MSFKKIFLILMIGLMGCSGSKQFMYQRSFPQQIRYIAVEQPDSILNPEVPGDYLQKMLAYMLFQEKPYFVQPLTETNQRLSEIDFAATAPIDLGKALQVQGLLRFDFFDWLKQDDKVVGFTLGISLTDLTQGKIVWQAVREYRGKEDHKSLIALKQYMQSKVKDKSNTPYFAELYTILKDTFQSLPAPNYTDEELTERLMSTEEPF